MSRMVAGLLGILCAACASGQAAATAQPTQTLAVRPMTRLEATGRPPGTVAPVLTPGPTPTPFSHLVRAGDTLLGVALEYGVDLNNLLLANPGINPRFLVVGSLLVVPLGDSAGPVPTPTPRPVTLSEVACHPESSGELWCFVSASLGAGPPIEGLIGLVTLHDSAGEPLRTEPAFGPLNLLRPEAEVPLVAYFAPPVPEYQSAGFTLLSAVSAGEAIDRYLPAELVDIMISYSSDGKIATVEGALVLAAVPESESLRVRVVAVARDSHGRIAGLTTLTNVDLAQSGPRSEFGLRLASLGPVIERVDLYAELKQEDA